MSDIGKLVSGYKANMPGQNWGRDSIWDMTQVWSGSSAFADPLAALGMYGTGNSLKDLFGGGDGGGRDDSGDVAFQTGELLRKQFEDWEKTFKPIELQALQSMSMNNPAVLPKALQDTRETVSQSYGAMEGVLKRQNEGLGLNPEPTATSRRLMNLSEGAAMAGGQNTTRANVRQMDEMLLMGATPNPNIAKATPGVTGR